MRKCASLLAALLVSLGLHVALVSGAYALVASVDARAREREEPVDEQAQLDLSSVDLSFSEQEDETAAVNDAPPPSETQEPVPPPPAPAFTEPPVLVVPAEPDAVPVAVVQDVERTELRPPDPEVPDVVPDASEPSERQTPELVSEPPPAEVPPHSDTPPSSAPSVPAPNQDRVEVQTVQPSLLRKIKRPRYPEGARSRGEEGDVVLELSIDAQGLVVDARIVSGCGFAELEQAAVAAVKGKALFHPARRGGEPVASRAIVTIDFRLKRR